MRHVIRTTIALAVGTVVAVALATAPAGASYQGDGTVQGPPVIIPVDCISILSRVMDLNEQVDALNDDANEAWDSWKSGDLSDDEMRGNIRDNESGANQVESAYAEASGRWTSNGCKGSLPPLNSWDFPWRELGIGG